MQKDRLVEFVKKYDLSKEEGVDIWKCHNSYILTHDAVTKVATIENIKIQKIESLHQDATSCRLLITMVKEDDDSCVVDCITSMGEADKGNSKNNYYGCMAEKRGIDRCVLKLINAYEYGIYSDVEAEDFKNLASDKQVRFLMEKCIKSGFDNSHWNFAGLTKDLAKKYFTELETYNTKQGSK
jgi:hypothetical protein